MNRPSQWILVSPAVLMIGGFVLVPLLLLIRVSLFEAAHGRGFYQPGTFTLQNYRDYLETSRLAIAMFTILFAIGITTLTIAIAYPLAIFLLSLPSRWQSICLTVILIPKMAGILATLFGLQRLLPRGLFASLIAEVYLIVPYAVLVIAMQLRKIDPQLIAAARGLGASRWQAFQKILLPLSFPGILIAMELSFIWGLAAFLGPLFLGGPDEMTISIEVHRQAFEYNRWPRAATEGVGLMAILIATMGILQLLRRPSP